MGSTVCLCARARAGAATGWSMTSTKIGERFDLWPRRRSTAAALVALLLLQAILFFAVTRHSFFFLDDYIYFNDAQQQHFLLRYLLTPVLHVYPAPGDRLASLLLQRFAPLNFTVARVVLIVFLAGTTVLLRQLVSTFARSDRWWTVALVVPFALSLTLVTPMSWWSSGLPVIPALFFTVVALSAWLRSYTAEESAQWTWVWVATIAVAAAGAFYLKFVLIPIYLLFLRLMIFPRLLGLPGGIRDLWRGLWKERMRWAALVAPPAAFVAVFVLSGLAGRSASGGSRPYLDYLTTAWFRAFIPASFMNARVASIPASFVNARAGGSSPRLPLGHHRLQPGALLGSGRRDMEEVLLGTSRMGALAVRLRGQCRHGRNGSAPVLRRRDRLCAPLLSGDRTLPSIGHRSWAPTGRGTTSRACMGTDEIRSDVDRALRVRVRGVLRHLGSGCRERFSGGTGEVLVRQPSTRYRCGDTGWDDSADRGLRDALVHDGGLDGTDRPRLQCLGARPR